MTREIPPIQTDRSSGVHRSERTRRFRGALVVVSTLMWFGCNPLIGLQEGKLAAAGETGSDSGGTVPGGGTTGSLPGGVSGIPAGGATGNVAGSNGSAGAGTAGNVGDAGGGGFGGETGAGLSGCLRSCSQAERRGCPLQVAATCVIDCETSRRDAPFLCRRKIDDYIACISDLPVNDWECVEGIAKPKIDVCPDEVLSYAGCLAAIGSPTALCSADCGTPNNGVCEDGGPDSWSADCRYGTDCGDCGPRETEGATTLMMCLEYCVTVEEMGCGSDSYAVCAENCSLLEAETPAGCVNSLSMLADCWSELSASELACEDSSAVILAPSCATETADFETCYSSATSP